MTKFLNTKFKKKTSEKIRVKNIVIVTFSKHSWKTMENAEKNFDKNKKRE